MGSCIREEPDGRVLLLYPKMNEEHLDLALFLILV